MFSVSVLQWLCNADSTSHSPPQRLLRFFTDLFASLSRGSKAVFQFYPESDEQVTFIMSFATRAGFGGGLCVDYVREVDPLLATELVTHLLPLVQPNSSKKKKFYLVLFAGQSENVAARKPQNVPAGLGLEGADKVTYERKREARSKKSGGKKRDLKGVDWILKKKELYRARGKEAVPRDSK